MRAIVLRGAGRVGVQEVPAPEPGPGEALVDVILAGICGTDLQLARGYMGFQGIPGHEFVGRVSRVTSPADAVLLGARVTGEINIGCDQCQTCAQGMARHCPRRRVLGILDKDGALADRTTLPVRNLKVVPPSLSDVQAVFVEPVAAAFEILDQIDVLRTTRALVLGDGRLGLLAAQALATRGAEVTVEGHHDAKLALARGFGLKTVLAQPGAAGHAAGDAAGDAAAGRPYDLVVEATGGPGGLDAALARVAPRGTIVMKTTHEGATPFAAWRAVVDEITLVGSRCGRFEPALEALAAGAVKVDPLVTAEYPLDQGVEAFGRAAERGALKVLIRAGA